MNTPFVIEWYFPMWKMHLTLFSLYKPFKLIPYFDFRLEFFKPILNIIDGQILACGGASENRFVNHSKGHLM